MAESSGGDRRPDRQGRPARSHSSRGDGSPRGGRRQYSSRSGTGNGGSRYGSPGRRFGDDRDNRSQHRGPEPEIPADIRAEELDPAVRRDLRSLTRDSADAVARHMVAAAAFLATDPQRAVLHARAAKNRASRVGVVRETAGIAAYHAGDWKEALAELRAARRMSGPPGLLAVMADCERGLGRPEKAVELGDSPDVEELDPESKVELAIVIAGAYHDMGRHTDALSVLRKQDLDPERTDAEAPRLFYAYADALALTGDSAGARQWFRRAGEHDQDGLLDVEERLAELEDGK